MVVTDLSERKKSDELIAAGRLSTSILESAAEAIAVCDRTGKIITVNEALERLCGFNPLFQSFDLAIPLVRNDSLTKVPKRFLIAEALKGTTLRGLEVTFHGSSVNLTILVVDDEPMLADTLAVIFRRAGYESIAVYSCEAVLPIIRKLQPLLIVSDVVMPGMDGIALAKIIRVNFPNCGVLLFSGNADPQDLLESAHEEGYAFEVLAKPVSPPHLLERVAYLAS